MVPIIVYVFGAIGNELIITKEVNTQGLITTFTVLVT
jgi:hypothetical protein